MKTLEEIARKLALTAFEIQAIKFNTTTPFTWASGYKMPIYNDNRRLISSFQHRLLVVSGLKELIKLRGITFDVVGGIATAGIPHATSLADTMRSPLIYVRSQNKEHGLHNKIEGILEKGQSVLMVEDVVSTGGSSLKAVNAVRNLGAVVKDCLCIFNYDFSLANDTFKNANCSLHSILTYDTLIDVATEYNYVSNEELEQLNLWRKDPFNWSINNKND
jgi:orotate phosphoribosyltransferase